MMVRYATTLSVVSVIALGFFTVAGCKSSTVSASGDQGSEISGPPTFNEYFQSRHPRVCAKVTRPPTPAQAAALVQCSTESENPGGSTPGNWLTTDLQVEMGSPRNEIAGTDDHSDIDVTAKVYPLRGQGTMWSCFPAKDRAPGQNCMSYPSQAPDSNTGICYKTNFGDWRCVMSVGGRAWVVNQKGPTTY